MFHYIDQPSTQFFTTGFFKTESESLDQLRITNEINTGGSYD